MGRRVFYTGLLLSLSGSAFYSADPQPDVNLFGVMFLFVAHLVWFYWADILAGFAYQEERRVIRREGTGLMLVRFAPLYLRELTRRTRNS